MDAGVFPLRSAEFFHSARGEYLRLTALIRHVITMHLAAVTAIVAATSVRAAAAPFNVPRVTLTHSSASGVVMPAHGLGTGGYKSDSSGGWGSYPECWAEAGGCGPWVANATTQYLTLAASGGETLIRVGACARARRDRGHCAHSRVTLPCLCGAIKWRGPWTPDG